MGLVHHGDRGSHCLSKRGTERVRTVLEPSVGGLAVRHDNTLAETADGLFKAEVINRHRLCQNSEAVA